MVDATHLPSAPIVQSHPISPNPTLRVLCCLQDQFASALPAPSGNYTLFAPTDAAFFDLLTTFSERVLLGG